MLAKYREKIGIESIGSESKNTVAAVKINNHLIYGVNGRLSPETLEYRRNLVSQIRWCPPRETVPTSLNKVQALSHAEAISMINAYEQVGELPKELEMYVDRPTCTFCKRDLPIIMRYFGVEKLTIYTLNSSEPIVIYAAE